MNIRKLALFLALLVSLFSFSQSIERKWNFGQNFFLDLNNGNYSLKIDSISESGTYTIEKNNVLLLAKGQKEAVSVPFYGLDRTSATFSIKGKDFLGITETNFPEKDIVKQNPENQLIKSNGITAESILRGAFGMLCLLIIAYIFSHNRKAINWRTVGVGLSFQLILAIGVLKVEWVRWIFEKAGGFFLLVLDFTRAGSDFLFGSLMDTTSIGYIFVFQILPTIIFFSALTSILFYYGIIQAITRGMAWVLTKFLGISGAESLSVTGNIFLGQTEAPLMIKSFLPKMTKSEILLVMVGGMATVAGGVLASYVSFLGGEDPALRLEFAKHLLAASVMAAPGAVVISKILYPQDEEIHTDYSAKEEKNGSNVLDVISIGTAEGLKLAANVGAMLLVFVALIAMVNYFLGWIGDVTHLNNVISESSMPYQKFSLEMILGTLFAPIMWLIGVAKEDMMLMGQLLGVKLAASEFIGYKELVTLKDPTSPTHLIYEKSVIIATYMLCGFANFASIGIQIGGIGSLAPSQRKTLSEFGLKAVLGGTLASLMSATIAGMLIG
ncbi:MAG: nucleoside transporter C-terminal domain-containing protein [Capnocytophaga sp.]|nr:nucleoside transporter C-terminal domain-containing protein [Capnocytophaga sp.]